MLQFHSMLVIYAINSYGSRRELATARTFRLAGPRLERGSERTCIGLYEGGAWAFRDRRFVRLDLEPGPVMIAVEDATGATSRKVGEYSSVSLVDGSAYADGQIIARCPDGCTAWDVRRGTPGTWPVLVLQSLH